MTALKNDRFLKALRREPTDRTPIWMMRQAGRYLPEYRAIRQKAGSFMNLCTNPELACEVTLQPLERFDFDAAILFSDILTIPDAMGLGLHFVEGEGPKFERPVRTASEIANLRIPDISAELNYVTDAVSLIRKELDGRVPLIGFSGSPWTLATYMVEGQSTREFRLIKGLLYEDPKSLHQLLEKLAVSVIQYLQAQIDAGAQAVQVFDTWGGMLSDAAYREFSLAYMAQIVEGLSHNKDIPIILFTKNGSPWLEEIADTGCTALGLDWSIGIDIARARVGDRVALQGNMDPAILRSTDEAIETEVQRILDSYGKGPGHIFNLGHGITPDVLPERVGTFVRAVHERSVN